jgi:hypothetical protein
MFDALQKESGHRIEKTLMMHACYKMDTRVNACETVQPTVQVLRFAQEDNGGVVQWAVREQ